MLQISVKAEVDEVAGFFGRFGKQVNFAAAVALTKTAQEGAAEMRREFVSKFDRATKYTTQNALFSKSANKRDMVASFGLKDSAIIQKSGGYTPADVLGHHFKGGASKVARYEMAFRKIGMLGFDEDIVVPKESKHKDSYGNIPASLIVKLISYFGAFGEQGYKANSTQATRDKLAKRTDKNTKGKRATKYVRINGVVYFYASGRDHLHRGIWAKTGTHGSDIYPVLIFASRANYKKRFDIKTFANRAGSNFKQHFSVQLENALRTAK